VTWNDIFWLVVGSGDVLLGMFAVARCRKTAVLVPQVPMDAAVDRWRERTGRRAVNWVWFNAIFGTAIALLGVLFIAGVAGRNGWI
jgi:hypothetical protein